VLRAETRWARAGPAGTARRFRRPGRGAGTRLAAELERLAGEEVTGGRVGLAATHLQWASDISPAQADRERRLLTGALHLTLAEEAWSSGGASPPRSSQAASADAARRPRPPRGRPLLQPGGPAPPRDRLLPSGQLAQI
jgi:hypothetical protein